MDKFYVAESYQGYDFLSEPFENEKGKMIVKIKGMCPRCGGSGHYSYNPLDGTKCLRCGGSGKEIMTVRAYTEKEYAQMQRAKETTRLRKQRESEAKQKDLVDNAATYKLALAKKLGFNENGIAFSVFGGDTFLIKDELKSKGARYNPALKWYFASPVELPDGYSFCEVAFDEIYDYHIQYKTADLKENAEQIVVDKINKLIGIPSTEFYPTAEKTRLRELEVTLTATRGFDGIYGYTFVYTFTLDNYVFIWMTTKSIDSTVGDKIILTGTIKKFDTYMGIKQTHLTRCIIA